MNADTEYKELVRQWIAAETKMQECNEQMRQLRDTKHGLNERLAKILQDRSLEVIPTSEGVIRLCKKRNYENLTFKYLEKWLPSIIAEPTQSQLLVQLLKDKREIRENYELTLSK